MISEEDAAFTYSYPEHFKILPAIHNWGDSVLRIKDGTKVAEGFSYTSDNNPEWMSPDSLRDWIDTNAGKIGKI